MTRRVSAYIPCFNNSATIAAAVESLRDQTLPVDELFVVDDGSADESAAIMGVLGVRVIRQPVNLGRGAARAIAMKEAANELVLCCDATNKLGRDFVEKAMHWFEDRKVAAVFGQILQPASRSAVDRWRGIYLFKGQEEHTIQRGVGLITFGTMVRKSHVFAVGNYNESLRHSEDGDLGERLIAAGFEIVSDPSLVITSVTSNTLGEVLERYWRWHAGREERVSLRGYLRDVVYSLKAMVWPDLQERDILRAGISLACPHYQFWRSLLRRRSR